MLIWSILLGLIVLQSKPHACLELGHSLASLEGSIASLEGRIAGGEVAKANQFPYQVGVSAEKVANVFSWCGGSLISDRWVLTAAHCVNSAISLTYYLGAVKRLEPQLLLRTTAPQIHLHPAWNAQTLENDLALLYLPKAIGFSAAIQPIKLPKIAATYASYDYVLATASGWGRISDASTTVSNELRYVIRFVESNKDCSYVYSSIKPTNLCMDTTGGRSTCSGDSGGPLAYYDLAEGAVILIGVTSYGKSLGCTKGYPAVFSRVTSYLNWINEVSGVANL